MSKEALNKSLCEFLGEAVTPFHAVHEMQRRLTAAGFESLDDEPGQALAPGGRYFVTRNGSSIVAFIKGQERAAHDGVRIVGAHTDSPCLTLKPAPELVANGYFQLGVQVYGGALLNPWFDRDLSLAGRVTLSLDDGSLDSCLINFRRPIAVIPSLAIHLDRDANKSRSVNAQTDMAPIICRLPEGDSIAIRDLVADQVRLEHSATAVAEIMDFELSFYDTQQPAVVGLRDEFLASARLDNLLSCFVGLESLLNADGSENALLVCNDHEEVGSQSAVGAQGPLLRSCLQRWAGSHEAYESLVQNSLLISVDNAHGVHPSYVDRHDGNHGPLLNQGPVIKVNASQRYATNAQSSSLFKMICRRADVPVQTFVVRSDMACGSTIGPISAGATGINTLDVGVPTFAMHSIRELAGTEDPYHLYKALNEFFRTTGSLSIG